MDFPDDWSVQYRFFLHFSEAATRWSVLHPPPCTPVPVKQATVFLISIHTWNKNDMDDLTERWAIIKSAAGIVGSRSTFSLVT